MNNTSQQSDNLSKKEQNSSNTNTKKDFWKRYNNQIRVSLTLDQLTKEIVDTTNNQAS